MTLTINTREALIMATTKQEIYDYVHTLLGGGMVDVELDPIHYETALIKALTRFRQRSDNSVEESYLFMPTVVDQNTYTLPNEVVEVRQIFRRGIGSRPSTSASGGPIFSISHIATNVANQTFAVNYNMLSVDTVAVTVNSVPTTAFASDHGARTITFNSPLNTGDVVNIKLFSSTASDGGSMFDPFSIAFTNAYLLSSSRQSGGGLATFDMFSQYQEMVGRMFGSFIEFKWSSSSKKLTILQRPRAQETLLLYCYNYRPDEELINDYLAKQWIKDYTLATCKYMLGEAREKFATIAGPQGGTSLNGSSLKQEAQAEMEKLETEVSMAVTGGAGYGFVIG